MAGELRLALHLRVQPRERLGPALGQAALERGLAALERTHARYFKTVNELTATVL